MIVCPIFIVALFWLIGMCLYKLNILTVIFISISIYLFYGIVVKIFLKNRDIIHKNDYFTIFLPVFMFLAFARTNSDYIFICEKMMQYEARYDNTIYEFEGRVTNIEKTKNGYEICFENVNCRAKNEKETIRVNEEWIVLPDCTGICYANKKLEEPVIGCTYYFKGKIITQSAVYDYGKYDVRKTALSHKRYGYVSITDYERRESELKGVYKYLAWIRQKAYDFKNCISNKIDILYSSDNSGMIKALLTGDKTEISESVSETFRGAGISHILAISGLHLTIMIAGFYNLLRKLWVGKLFSFILSGILNLFFLIMTGFNSSTVRATIMILIYLFGKTVGREVHLLTSLSLSFMFMTVINPMLIFETSFVLSYFCIFIISISSKSIIPKGLALQNVMFFVSSWFYFEISPYQFLINVPVLTLFPTILIMGIVSVVIEFIIPDAGQVFAFGTEMLIKIMLEIVKISLKFPYARILTGRKNVGITICGILSGILILRMTSYKKDYDVYEKSIKTTIKAFKEKFKISKVKNGICLVIFALLPTLLFIRENNDGTYFLNVGQGNCMAFLRDGKVMLIDCGSSSEKDVFSYIVEPFLKYNGINKIELIALTHSDSDHINGVERLLEKMDNEKYYRGRIKVEKILLPLCEKDDKTFLSVERRAVLKNVKVEKINSKTKNAFKFHNLNVEVLYPPIIVESSNETSLSFLVSDEKMDYLILGDLGITEEEKIAFTLENKYKEMNKNSKKRIINIAHHGSAGSTSDTLLEQFKPDFAVISCSRFNTYGHPSKLVLDKLSRKTISFSITWQSGTLKI